MARPPYPQLGPRGVLCWPLIDWVAMGRLGIDSKFRRARSLVDELEHAVAEYLASEPFSLETREEPSGDLRRSCALRHSLLWSGRSSSATLSTTPGVHSTTWRTPSLNETAVLLVKAPTSRSLMRARGTGRSCAKGSPA